MNYPLISEYIEAIKSSEDNFEELTNLRPVLGEDGLPVMTGGNFAVVFKMKDERDGKLYAVKCFTKEQEGRNESYKLIADELKDIDSPYIVPIKYLVKELFVDSKQTDETEFPVLLMDWVDGKTLDKYLRENLDDKYALEMLAYRFSQLAQWIIPQPFAHGDLKPDNILVREDGSLVLVDYDGMYVPEMKGQKARELGSPDFRHPMRTEDDFDEHIDDFPLVSILLSLKAISLNPQLLEEYGAVDRLLFSENDYREIFDFHALDAIKPLTQYPELTTLVSLFFLVSSQKNLSYVSVNLLYLVEPEKQIIISEINDICSSVLQDNKGHVVDQYGAVYSRNFKVLLRLPYAVVEYNIKEGTEIVAAGCFDHFSEWADRNSVITYEACLKKVYFPASVKYVSDWAFGDDGQNLIEIGVEENPNYYKQLLGQFSNLIIQREPYKKVITRSTSIYDISGAEYTQDGNELISLNYLSPDIPSYKIKEGVKTINDGAAQSLKFIHAIIVPDGVEIIKGSAFRYSSLSSISLPTSLRIIAQYAFEYCNKLLLVEIPEGVEIIDNHAFYSCEKLESVILPSSLIQMNHQVFGANNSLKTVIFNGIPTFSNDCFDKCQSLQTIHIPQGARGQFEQMLPAYKNILVEKDLNTDVLTEDLLNAKEDLHGVMYSIDGRRLLMAPRNIIGYSIKCGTRVICDNAFCNCCRLTTIVLPEGVQYIGNQAFCDCVNITSVFLPNSVLQIGEMAFSGCENIKTIHIPAGKRQKFEQLLPHFKDLFVEEENWSTTITHKDLATALTDECGVKYSIDGRRLLKAPYLEEYSIKKGTKVICDGAFMVDTLLFGDKTVQVISKLTSLIIPDGVKIIGDGAFIGCRNIESFTIPNSVMSIGKGAFGDCENIISLTIPDGVLNIKEGTFAGCKRLKNITIPNSVEDIGDRAFIGCVSLSNITIPNRVKSIGESAFFGCINLISIKLPNSITSIGDSAFQNCYSLTSIIIPKETRKKFEQLLPEYKDKLVEK